MGRRRHAFAGDDGRSAGELEIATHARTRIAGTSGRRALDTLDRKVSLGRTQSDGEPAHDVDKAYDQEQEEGRRGSLFDENEFDDHAEKQNQRERMINDGANTDAGGLHDL